MSTSRSRIDVLTVVFLGIVAIVLGHLFVVMVSNHEIWAARSHENRWSFRSVPSLRGAIRDRSGRVLVHDEPAMQLSVYYRRFRMRHPIGAAVHGATWLAQQQPGSALVTYDYGDGILGADAAGRDLLAMPAAMLRRGALGKEAAAQLATAVTTLLSTTSGMPRRTVFKALRLAATERPTTACGDVLEGFLRDELLAAYAASLGHLRWFDRELGLRLAAADGGLMAMLDKLGSESLAGKRTSWLVTEGERSVRQQGDPTETIAWPVSDHVPFELAAGLRIGELAHPGLIVRPSLRRVSVAASGTTLNALLGDVRDLGRLRSESRTFERYARRELPPDWLEVVVPPDAAVTDAELARIQSNALRQFESMSMRYERGGWTGMERAFDAALSGHLGMRLVERDSRQREQWMWSNLRVKTGDDVRITIDAELQGIVEGVVVAARERAAAQYLEADQRQRVNAAMAVIDARSGDVLAFAGAPVLDRSAAQIPGNTWHGNGDVGSVVKPFLLIEQLVSAAAGRPHLPLTEIEPCSGKFVHRGVRLGCVTEGHWDEGMDPVAALAKSCNLFYYQIAEGLGMAGVNRALRRFGLMAPGDDDEFGSWQPRIGGVSVTPPRVLIKMAPSRAIGYGVNATPLSVARAYAGIATGRLPTLGLLAGTARPVVALGGIAAELEVVREGLRGCVEYGTARNVVGLADFRVVGKTGTAQVSDIGGQNNAWFAGYLPWTSKDGVQLCFAAVIYWVPDGTHGAEAAGGMVAQMLAEANGWPQLRARYIQPGGGK